MRHDIITVPDIDLGQLRMPGVIPKLANYGGIVWRTGPALGEDNELVFREWLGMTANELEELRKEGVT